jgi:ribosomal protein L11 methylase PrmA
MICGALAAACAFAQQTEEVKKDVPYVPTPQNVVDEMLRLANVSKGDVVYDLGCGDGRLVVTAVKNFGAKRGVGVDIDPQRIAESNQNAKAAGVTGSVKFVVQDLFQTDFSEATVVTLYLLPDVNLKLRPKLLSELKPGTRVVSHAFSMGDWEPEKKVTVEPGGQTLYLWTIPAKGSPAATGNKP